MLIYHGQHEQLSKYFLKSELKTTLKSLENGEVSAETKNQALKSLDVAFSKGVISKNYRDRNKSRISSL